ncbi:hypothetical protein E2C01_049923 [Portunus trituberculatus]|uniref:Uncharacterized protein n=1 Tax=Portunus trituberculatus TaxID=210409 RepID=A0A5B7GEJ2_PORTR|nr:hypothetical protein [Portunus trituberculatus]
MGGGAGGGGLGVAHLGERRPGGGDSNITSSTHKSTSQPLRDTRIHNTTSPQFLGSVKAKTTDVITIEPGSYSTSSGIRCVINIRGKPSEAPAAPNSCKKGTT